MTPLNIYITKHVKRWNPNLFGRSSKSYENVLPKQTRFSEEELLQRKIRTKSDVNRIMPGARNLPLFYFFLENQRRKKHCGGSTDIISVKSRSGFGNFD